MDIWLICFLTFPSIVILFSIFIPIYDYIRRKQIIKSFYINQQFCSVSYLDKQNPFYNCKIITIYTIEDIKRNYKNELWIKYSTKSSVNGRDDANKKIHIISAWEFSDIIKNFKK